MSSASARTYVYIGNADSQDITTLELMPNGDVVLVETVAIPGPATPGSSTPLAVSPDRRRLIVGLRNEPYTAVTFDIDPATGRLTSVGAGPLADAMAYLSIDRSGHFLFGASYGGNKVTVNAIGPNGVIAPAHQIAETAPNAHCIVVDPTNRFVLHSSLGGNMLYQQTFDAELGTLTPNEPPTISVAAESGTRGGPRHLVFAPNGRFVYLLNEHDAAIHVLPWDSETGTLRPAVQTVLALPEGTGGNPDFKPWAADIHLTPDGRFLYASERTTHTLAAFGVDGDSGMLSPAGSFPTEQQPRGFAIDPTGHVLLAVGQLSNRLTSYVIDQSTGALTQRQQIAVGNNPNWVEIVKLP